MSTIWIRQAVWKPTANATLGREEMLTSDLVVADNCIRLKQIGMQPREREGMIWENSPGDAALARMRVFLAANVIHAANCYLRYVTYGGGLKVNRCDNRGELSGVNRRRGGSSKRPR